MQDNQYNKPFKCVICGEHIHNEWGQNPSPLKPSGKCCKVCNDTYVLPARLKALKGAY